ncbi:MULTISPECIES: NADP-dependent oxidoreductase [Streptomyces]|uniref:Putative oxidoreductase n=2 Tax=Streptomyces scabiei TaxID=1930 RepID=C9Z7Y3_STRSW|nr:MULTISPECIES: NADP-dependent oxidoreductase [Streptomyces]MBP5872755.1 NADP-dependent oxidoreductase [Streptomyces sp. LBUM 1485]KFG03784.1 zinc-binding alcohol dehydrogenase [Streptomyces scabiei]MBP5873240.1 NADP-dependent oxidoreductase [Streptomyces sp. LBUM 1477]MBP5880923.1 NADP-dependent oxidoreductase [Streptomyces sp. LBUM 1487]MBP5896191.1 NADP-dependent oxidoreductase [Streptomyces sp. LBUM 1481]
MALPTVNRQWLLARRPVGAVTTEDFRYTESDPPVPGEGEVLVRTLYFGYDASQRIWLTDDGGYMPPIQVGEPMRTMGIGQVVASRDPDYRPGDLVEGFMSWQDYVLLRADGPMPLRVLPASDHPLSWNLGVFGVGGLTAYFGVTDGLRVEAGDTVVISAATGATGSLAGGIARALGAKQVIGIAGGPEKCRWVVEEAGYDAAVDYKNDKLDERLRELCPDGVDAYFDNVGGDMLDTLLLSMAPRGRVLICGAMSSGYTDVRLQGPVNYMRIATHQLTVRGILLFHYADRLAEGAAQLGRWVKEGRLHVEESVVEGFENAPALLPTMFTGKQPGKLLLKLGDPQ